MRGIVLMLAAFGAMIAPGAAATLCGDKDLPLIVDRQVRQPPRLAEPAARRPFRDPAFGTCLVRLTDRTADLAPGDSSGGLKNEYARVQAFIADASLILIRGTAASWYLYDARTLAPLRRLPFEGTVDPRWDARDPATLYVIDGTRLVAHDVRGEHLRVVRDFAAEFPGQRLAAVWTRYEGSPSRDGRTWGLMAEDENWIPAAFLVYDLAADRIVAKRDLRGVPGIADDIDNVTISPLGNFLVAAFGKYCERGETGSDARPCGFMVYDRNLTHGRGLARIMGHYDLALDATGREVAVYQDVDTDEIAMLDLASGKRTALLPLDFSRHAFGLHFSGQGPPGWALVSTHDASADSILWMDDQVFAVELEPGGRVVRLAHTHSRVDFEAEHFYFAEPHATVSRDFTRVLFTTNWGRVGTDRVETTLIDLPRDWWTRLP